MQRLARRPIPKERLLLLCAVVIQSSMAVAQRPVVPPTRPPGVTIHIPAPPILRTPIYQAPISHPPVTYAPMYAPPRNPMLPSATTVGLASVRPPVRPIHPRPPLIFVYSPQFALSSPFWRFNLCWWATCDLFWPWTSSYTTFSSTAPMNYVSQVYETPVYVYGYEREDTPQLYLKDGTILNVTDYWVIDGQLHFFVIEQVGAKPSEQSIPFEALDLQKTVDANSTKGFRFVLRNEPVEQYMRDHPEGPPPAVVPRRQ